jgi:hypothetical protein
VRKYTDRHNQDSATNGQKGKNALVECQPMNKSIDQEAAKHAMKMASKSSRWWSAAQHVCPLSGFPISLLPYPPFKLRMQAGKANPHALVDGRFLALQLVASGSLMIWGRCLQPTEITALGQYIRRCKLGPFPPERAIRLEEDAKNPELSYAQQQEAFQKLQQLRTDAKAEFRKLKMIQENRIMKLHQKLTGCQGVTMAKSRSRKAAKDSELQMGSVDSIYTGSCNFFGFDANYDLSNAAFPMFEQTISSKFSGSKCNGLGVSPADALSEVSTNACEDMDCWRCGIEDARQSQMRCLCEVEEFDERNYR